MLDHEAVKTWHAVALLFVFWAMWLYASETQRVRHEAFFTEVGEFINRGDRFTADDGRALKARVEAIEKQLEATDGDVQSVK